jgi:hypothetical protein
MSTIVDEEKKDQKCPRCKCYAYPKDFINPTGRVLKTCQKCRNYSKKNRVKNQCEHGRQRGRCKQCSDPIKVTINNWISHSRQSDKKYDRYDPDNFIDKYFLQGLVEDSPNCYYCDIPLQYAESQDDLATIRKGPNRLGHNKTNCVLACRKCVIACRKCNYSH